ncbi:MAG: hypothetical protein RLZZ184_1507 [Cyanobacteriota bacterium]
MEQEISKTMAMDLTLEELEKGIGTIKAFVEDMDKSKIGVIIKDKPDFEQFYIILDNLRDLVEQWKEDYLD